MAAGQTAGSVKITATADASDFGADLDKEVKAAMSEILKGVVDGMRDVNKALGDVDAEKLAKQLDEVVKALDDIDAGPLEETAKQSEKASQSTEKVKKSAEGASTALKRIDASALRDIVSGSQDANVALSKLDRFQLDALISEANKVGRTLGTEIKEGASDAERALRSLNGEGLDKLIREAQDAKKELGELGGKGKGIGEGLKDAFGDAAGGVEIAGFSLEGFAGKMGKLGPIAAGVAATIGVAFAGIKESLDRTEVTAHLRAEFDLTAQEAQKAGDVARDVFRSGVGESIEGVTATVSELHNSLANLTDSTPEELEKLTKSATNLQSVFGIETQESIQTVSQLIRNGLAKDGQEGFDLLTAAFQRMPKAMREELPDLINEYGTFFHSIGFDGQEAFGAIVAASQNGAIAMDKVGDAVKEFGIRVTDLGDTNAQDVLKNLGTSGTEMAAAFAAGGDTAKAAFDKVIGGLSQIKDPAAQAQAAVALFGTPLEDLDKSKIPGFISGLQNAGGEMAGFKGKADEMGKSLDTPGSKLESFGRTLKGGLMDVLANIGDGLIKFGGALNENLIKPITEHLTPGFNTLKGVVSDMWDNHLKKFFDEIQPKLEKLTPLVELLGTVLGAAFSGAAKAISFAWGLIAPIFDLLLGAVSLAIGAVGNLVQFFSHLPENIGKAFDAVGKFFSDLPGKIGDALAGIGEFALDALGNLGSLLVGFFVGLPLVLIGAIGDLGSFLITWFGEQWTNFTTALPGILESIGQFFIDLPGNIVSAIGDLGGAIGNFFSTQWNNFLTGLPIVIDAIGTFFSELPGKIIGWLGDLGGAIGGFFSDQWNNVTSTISRLIDDLIGFFTGLPSRMANAALGLFDGIADSFKSAYNSIVGWWNSLSLTLGPITIDPPFFDPITLGPYTLTTPQIPTLADGGIAGRRPDGTLWGPGTGKSDSILGLDQWGVPTARVSTGERVLSVEQTAVLRRLLPGFADGGVVGNALTAPSGGSGSDDTVVRLLRQLVANTGDLKDLGGGGKRSGGGFTLGTADSQGLTDATDEFVALGDAASTAVDGSVLPATDAMTAAASTTGQAFTDLATVAVTPALTAIGDQTATLAGAIDTAVNAQMIPAATALGDAITRTQAEGIQPAFNAIQSGLSNVEGFFGDTVAGVTTAWDGLRGATARPVNFMLGTVWNQGLLPAWNKVAEFLPDIQPATPVATIPGFRTGGALSGPGTGTSDDILMWGSTGEHMVTATEVLKAGGQHIIYAIRDMIARGVPFTWDNGKLVSDIGRKSLDAYGAQVQLKGVGKVNPEGLFDALLPKFADGGAVGNSLSVFSQRGTGITDAQLEAKRKEEWEKFVKWLQGEAGQGSSSTSQPKSGDGWDQFWKWLREQFHFEEADMPKFATGGAVEPWMVQLQKGHDFARAQNGKDYQWGGPSGEGSSFDCSGFMGSVAAAILDQNPWQRYWATGSFAGYPATGPQGFTKGGDNGFTIGVTDDPGGPGGGHTAGTLGALPDLGIARPVNVESGGALGNVHYGGGTDPSTFASMYHLPIGANGFFVGGGAGPTPEEMRQFLKDQSKKDFAEFLDPIRSGMPYAPPPVFTGIPPQYLSTGDAKLQAEIVAKIDALNDQLSSSWVKASGFASTKKFDTGGILAHGSGAWNDSGLPERILSPQQTAAFERMVSLLAGGGGSDLLAKVGARIGAMATGGGANGQTVVHDNRTINSPVHNHGVRDFASFRDRDEAHLLALLDG